VSRDPPTKPPHHRPAGPGPSASQRDQPAEEQVQIHETALPGVGFRHDFTTSRGRQLGVVSHRTGRRDLILYNQHDPDAAQEVVQLTSVESEALGGLLGGSRITRSLTELQQQLEGLAIAWLSITQGSPYAGRTIAGTQARSRTGSRSWRCCATRPPSPRPGPTSPSRPATPPWWSEPLSGSRP
jgi:TrkA domain protein